MTGGKGLPLKASLLQCCFLLNASPATLVMIWSKCYKAALNLYREIGHGLYESYATTFSGEWDGVHSSPDIMDRSNVSANIII